MAPRVSRPRCGSIESAWHRGDNSVTLTGTKVIQEPVEVGTVGITGGTVGTKWNRSADSFHSDDLRDASHASNAPFNLLLCLITGRFFLQCSNAAWVLLKWPASTSAAASATFYLALTRNWVGKAQWACLPTIVAVERPTPCAQCTSTGPSFAAAARNGMPSRATKGLRLISKNLACRKIETRDHPPVWVASQYVLVVALI